MTVSSDELPPRRSAGAVELVHAFHDQMPTGVTVADDGRIFVSYPRWGDDVKFTVAELREGQEVPFPDLELQQFTEENAPERIVSVQSVVVDPAGRCGCWTPARSSSVPSSRVGRSSSAWTSSAIGSSGPSSTCAGAKRAWRSSPTRATRARPG